MPNVILKNFFYLYITMVCFLNEFISINNYMTSVDVLKLAFKYIYSTFLKESSYNLVSKDFHLNCVYVVFRYLFNKYKFFSYSNFQTYNITASLYTTSSCTSFWYISCDCQQFRSWSNWNDKWSAWSFSSSKFLSKLRKRWQKCTNGRRSAIQGENH